MDVGRVLIVSRPLTDMPRADEQVLLNEDALDQRRRSTEDEIPDEVSRELNIVFSR